MEGSLALETTGDRLERASLKARLFCEWREEQIIAEAEWIAIATSIRARSGGSDATSSVSGLLT